IISLCGLLLVFISNEYSEYSRYYLYGSITIMIPFMISNLIKQRREDQLNGTTMFKSSIYRMLIVAVMLVVFFLITKQNYM
ncbi:hypothetical protein, partial [Flavobacterium sp. A45]|uniref:hypothetical protein n=1 Tax=Flavobacterium sp. A45 TaxID=1945862 RepID=UPI001C2C1841